MDHTPNDEYNGIAVIEAPQVDKKPTDPWSNLSEKEEILDALGDTLQTMCDRLGNEVHLDDVYHRARQVYHKYREGKGKPSY